MFPSHRAEELDPEARRRGLLAELLGLIGDADETGHGVGDAGLGGGPFSRGVPVQPRRRERFTPAPVDMVMSSEPDEQPVDAGLAGSGEGPEGDAPPAEPATAEIATAEITATGLPASDPPGADRPSAEAATGELPVAESTGGEAPGGESAGGLPVQVQAGEPSSDPPGPEGGAAHPETAGSRPGGGDAGPEADTGLYPESGERAVAVGTASVPEPPAQAGPYPPPPSGGAVPAGSASGYPGGAEAAGVPFGAGPRPGGAGPVPEPTLDELSRMVVDPSPDRRLAALEALSTRPGVPPATIRQALRDPVDEVRAVAVRLAAAAGPDLAGDLVRLSLLDRSLRSTRAVLDVLPGLVARHGLDDDTRRALLANVGRSIDTSEAASAVIYPLAHAIGFEALYRAIDGPHDVRAGALRLLRALDTPDARAVVASAAAADSLTLGAGFRSNGDPASPHGTTRDLGAEMIGGLAQALLDPDDAVRSHAREALGHLSRPFLVAWVGERLSSSNLDVAVRAAAVASAIPLPELALRLLDRATTVPGDEMSTFVGAVSNTGLDAGSLVRSTESLEAGRRPAALRVLWRALGPAVVPEVRALRRDTSGAVRMAVLEVLGESDDPAAIEVAHDVLRTDSSPAVRAAAVKIIARAQPAERLSILGRAILDPDPDVRATAVEILPHKIEHHAAELLFRALLDADERVWRAAIEHLARVSDSDVGIIWRALREAPEQQRAQLYSMLERFSSDKIGALALQQLRSEEPDDRVLAVHLAGRAASAECVRATIKALADPVPAVRRAAAGELSRVRSPESVPALAKALRDPEPKVRLDVVRALGVIDDDSVAPVLIEAFADPDSQVRELTGHILARWRSPLILRRLVDALRTPTLRDQAADLLVSIGPAATDALVDGLIDDDATLAPAIGRVLREVTDASQFLEVLTQVDADARVRAVEALGAIGGQRAIDGLVTPLSDPDERVRVRALSHLGRLGDRRAYDQVRRTYMVDPVPEVVEAAAAAIRMFDERAAEATAAGEAEGRERSFDA